MLYTRLRALYKYCTAVALTTDHLIACNGSGTYRVQHKRSVTIPTSTKPINVKGRLLWTLAATVYGWHSSSGLAQDGCFSSLGERTLHVVEQMLVKLPLTDIRSLKL